MDNLSNAIFLSFAMFALVIGLSFAVYLLSNLNSTATVLIQATDKTKDYQLVTYDSSNLQTSGSRQTNVMQTRIVGMDTVVATLYKYYKESFDVEIYVQDSADPNQVNLRQIFNSTIENVLFIQDNTSTDFQAYNTQYENSVFGNKKAPWIANRELTKQRVDMYIASQSGYINGYSVDYTSNGLSALVGSSSGKFREEFIQYIFSGETISNAETGTIDSLVGNVKPEDKILIRYILLND